LKGDQNEFQPDHFYTISESSIIRVKRFMTTALEYKFLLKNLQDSENPSKSIARAFDHALNKITSKIESTAMAGASFVHPNMDKPMLIHFKPVKYITGKLILDEIEHFLNSNQEIDLEHEEAYIKLITVVPIQGDEHHYGLRFLTHIDSLKRGHGGCFLNIKNQDSLCLARSIVTARAYIHQDDRNSKYYQFKRSDKFTIQKTEAETLMRLAGLSKHTGSCGTKEIDKIQQALPDYKIKIFCKEANYALIYEGNFFQNYKLICFFK